jgi:hypothetical protein
MTETPDPGDNQEGAPAAAPDLAAWMAIYGARLQRYFTRRAPPAAGPPAAVAILAQIC